jgi:hypothetical protein
LGSDDYRRRRTHDGADRCVRGALPFERSDNFRKELERLIGMGLVGRREGRGMRTLFSAGDDVQQHLLLTERGRSYLDHRDSALDS